MDQAGKGDARKQLMTKAEPASPQRCTENAPKSIAAIFCVGHFFDATF